MNRAQAILVTTRNAFRFPAAATAIEPIIGMQMLESAPGGKLPPSNFENSTCDHRVKIAELKRLEVLRFATSEWQTACEIIKHLAFPESGMRSSIDNLVRTGRLESRKIKGIIYVRLPQVKFGVDEFEFSEVTL